MPTIVNSVYSKKRLGNTFYEVTHEIVQFHILILLYLYFYLYLTQSNRFLLTMKISNKTGSLTPVDLFITVLVDLLNSRPYFFTLSLLVFNFALVFITFHFVFLYKCGDFFLTTFSGLFFNYHFQLTNYNSEGPSVRSFSCTAYCIYCDSNLDRKNPLPSWDLNP